MKRQPVDNSSERICPNCGGKRATNKAVLFDSNDLNAVCLICKFALSKQHPGALTCGNGQRVFIRDTRTFKTRREPKNPD